MARIPMVSRTITTTKVTLLCVNVKDGESENMVVTVPRTYKDDEKLLKVIRPMYETDELKLVHVLNKETQETLYGMTEADFIKNAEVLPPRTPATQSPKAPKKSPKK